MKSKLSKASVLALFLGKAKAIEDGTNGLAGEAPCVESFQVVFDWDALGTDPHAVHGTVASDGGYVAVGSGLEGEEGEEGAPDSFIVKTKGGCSAADITEDSLYPELTDGGSGCGGYDWITKYGASGKTDKANWVAESPDGTYFIVAGITEASGGKTDMNIAKIAATDGEIIWEMNHEAESGAETVAFTSDGGFIIGGYLDNETDAIEVYFKSSGQIDGENAKPFIAKISAADAEGSSAPSSFEWTYTCSDAENYGSAKAIRIDSSDNVYAVIGHGAIVKLDDAGEEVWKTEEYSLTQINDVELASDGVVAVGHSYERANGGCWFTGCGIIKGSMIKFDADGEEEWQKDYGNYPGGVSQFREIEEGNWSLVYNECWGVAPKYSDDGETHDGYVMSCGTGIEGCNLLLGPFVWAECIGDPRGIWRALTVATDLEGERIYSRMDSYGVGLYADQGETRVGASAGEYVFINADGGHVIITDEGMGMGFLTIAPYTEELCENPFGGNQASALTVTLSLALTLFAFY